MPPSLAAPTGLRLTAAAATLRWTFGPASLGACASSLSVLRRFLRTSPSRADQRTLNLGGLAEAYGDERNVPALKTDPELTRMPVSVRPLLSEDIEVAENSKHEERCVLVSGLPFSIMPPDVQAAAGPGLIPSVQTVEMLYSGSGNFSGKAVVTLDASQAAVDYARQARQTPCAGRLLNTDILPMQRAKRIVLPSDPTTADVRKHNSLASISLFASFLTSRFGGRVVALRGVPPNFNARRLYNMLWHGDWKLEPQRTNPEWNSVLTRLFHAVRRTPHPSKRFVRYGRSDFVTEAMVRVSRDSGSRSRGIPLKPYTTADGLIDAGRLDPIFPYIMYVRLKRARRSDVSWLTTQFA